MARNVILLCSGYSQANTVIGAKAQRHVTETRLPIVVQRTECIWFKAPDVHGHSRRVSRALLSAAKGCRKIIAPATSSRLGVLSLLLVYMLVTNRISGQQKDTIPPMHIAHIGMRQRLVPWPYSTILYLSRSMGWTTNETLLVEQGGWSMDDLLGLPTDWLVDE